LLDVIEIQSSATRARVVFLLEGFPVGNNNERGG